MSYSASVNAFFNQHPGILQPIYSDWADKRIGVDQPPAGACYPFIHGSNDILSRILDIDVLIKQGEPQLPLKIDWFVSDKGIGYLPKSNPFYIEWSDKSLEDWAALPASQVTPFEGALMFTYPVMPVHNADLLIADKGSSVQYDTRSMEYQLYDAGWYRIHIWEDDQVIIQVAERTTSNNTAVAGIWFNYVEPMRSVIAGECVRYLPKTCSAARPNIVLEAGYNTTITEQLISNGIEITINAVAGSGSGRAPTEATADDFLKSLNNVQPDELGNLQITGIDCYSVEPLVDIGQNKELVSVGPALNFTSACIPCCTCQDYANVYEAERVLTSTLNTLTGNYMQLADDYHRILDRFKNARDISPLKVMARPLDAYRVQFMMGYCNNTEHCIRDIYLFSEFEYYIPAQGNIPAKSYATDAGDGGLLLEMTAKVQDQPVVDYLGDEQWQTKPDRSNYVLGGSYPSFWGYFKGINPGTMGAIFFTMYWPEAVETSKVVSVFSGFITPYSVPSDSDTSPIVGKIYGEHPRKDTYAEKVMIPELKILPVKLPIPPEDDGGEVDP